MTGTFYSRRLRNAEAETYRLMEYIEGLAAVNIMI
jgi:hypothetical protein